MEGVRYRTLPEKTADALSDYLYQENYRVGQKLPNELELAERFDVSRGTLRRAVEILQERGILEVRRGSGTYISGRMGLSDDPLGLTLVSDKKRLVQDMLDVRLMIEPETAMLAAERITPSEIRALEEICRKLDAAVEKGESYYQLDIEFHRFIAGCSRNLVIHSLYPAIVRTILLQESITDVRTGGETSRAHREICRAISSHKGSEAAYAMRAHLMKNKERFRER